MDTEKSSKEDTKFEDRLTLFVEFYILAIILGFSVAVYGITHENTWEKLGNLLIMTTSVATTVIMVYFIALQTKATRDMAKKTSAQVQLTYDMVKQMVQETTIMNETLIEMKKQRMNIEEFKNSLITYLRYVNGILTSNSTYASYHRIQEPYQYLIDGYHKRIGANLSPSEVGLLWRISIFIRRFLEMRGFSWQELDKYHDLIHRLKDSNTPRDEKPKLANEIREKSKELGKIIENIIQEIEEMGNQKFEEEILKILES